MKKILIFKVLGLFPLLVWAEKMPVVRQEFPPL